MDLIDELRVAARRIPTMHGSARAEPVAARGEMDEFERRIAHPLPPLWRRVYSEVGNGGFGPGYGLLGLVTGARSDEGNAAVELYELFRQPDPEDAAWAWPQGVVPVCHWGCAIYSCVDVRSGPAPIVRFDPNGHGPETGWDGAWWQEASSSEAWLRAWVEGRLTFASPAT